MCDSLLCERVSSMCGVVCWPSRMHSDHIVSHREFLLCVVTDITSHTGSLLFVLTCVRESLMWEILFCVLCVVWTHTKALGLTRRHSITQRISCVCCDLCKRVQGSFESVKESLLCVVCCVHPHKSTGTNIVSHRESLLCVVTCVMWQSLFCVLCLMWDSLSCVLVSCASLCERVFFVRESCNSLIQSSSVSVLWFTWESVLRERVSY